jgi:hypothetical protein
MTPPTPLSTLAPMSALKEIPVSRKRRTTTFSEIADGVRKHFPNDAAMSDYFHTISLDNSNVPTR